MCLISLRWAPTHAVPIIIAANRDEYYQRSSLPAQYWQENPAIFAGKDLLGGGSWMGVNHKTGRFAVLTNYRECDDCIYTNSRGKIVYDFLTSVKRIDAWLYELAKKTSDYAGFNLLVGNLKGLYYMSNREAGIRLLPPGIHGFSNGLWGDTWPKVTTLTQAMNVITIRNEQDLLAQKYVNELMDALHNPHYFSDNLLPDTGVGIALERARSPCFIIGDNYGTRTSTVMMIEKNGQMHWNEQHYLPQGKPAEYYTHTLNFERGQDIQG